MLCGDDDDDACTRVDFYTKFRMCGRSESRGRVPGAGCRAGHRRVVSSVQKVVEVSTSKGSLMFVLTY